MQYSPYLHTLFDQAEPVGSMGCGAHYSILSCAQWRDVKGKPYTGGSARIQKLGVIWDEDHDTRVIQVIEQAYFKGLLAPVRFIGERKGSLTVLLDPKYTETIDLQQLENPWCTITDDVDSDYWNLSLHAYGDRDGMDIIQDSAPRVATYLESINQLWGLDLPRETYRMPRSTYDGDDNSDLL